jgi:hypothetical protein
MKGDCHGLVCRNGWQAQSAKQNPCEIFSLDNHFQLMKDIVGFELLD